MPTKQAPRSAASSAKTATSSNASGTSAPSTQSILSDQDQILDGIRKGQQALLENLRTWVEAVEKSGPALAPVALPADLPQPKQVLATSFDFAEKLLANQREFAEELLAAVPAPATK